MKNRKTETKPCVGCGKPIRRYLKQWYWQREYVEAPKVCGTCRAARAEMRDRALIIRFTQGETAAAIAKEWNVTITRVHQIRRRAERRVFAICVDGRTQHGLRGYKDALAQLRNAVI